MKEVGLGRIAGSSETCLIDNLFVWPIGLVQKRNRTRKIRLIQQNPVIALDKIMKEVCLGRIAGPFKTCPIDNIVVSPIDLV